MLGKWGEDIACEKLVADGFAICERNWRMGHYEIDIVAMRGDTLVFAEVKTRSEPDIDPLDAIDDRKISHMAQSAGVYIESRNLPHNVRFDLFGISGSPDTGYTVEHIADAFDVPLTSY